MNKYGRGSFLPSLSHPLSSGRLFSYELYSRELKHIQNGGIMAIPDLIILLNLNVWLRDSGKLIWFGGRNKFKSTRLASLTRAFWHLWWMFSCCQRAGWKGEWASDKWNRNSLFSWNGNRQINASHAGLWLWIHYRSYKAFTYKKKGNI